MAEESTMKERMIERLVYLVIMVLLAQFGGVVTDEWVVASHRAEGKQEQRDYWRALYAELVVEMETLKETCEEE